MTHLLHNAYNALQTAYGALVQLIPASNANTHSTSKTQHACLTVHKLTT